MILLFECFCRGGLAGPSRTKTPRLLDSPETFFLMYSVICALQLTFFFLFYSLFLHSSFLWTACIHHIYCLSSLLFLPDGFLKFLPSLLFTTCTIVQHFFFLLLKTSFVFLPPHSHCVSAQSFKSRHVWKTYL